MRHHLDDGDLHAALDQSFRHLETDETTADDDRALGLIVINEGGDFVHVLERPELENVIMIGTGDRWSDRTAALGEDQLGVFIFFLLTGAGINCMDDPVGAIDLSRCGMDVNRRLILVVEALRTLQDELGAVLDIAADVVGQAAIGKRNVRT